MIFWESRGIKYIVANPEGIAQIGVVEALGQSWKLLKDTWMPSMPQDATGCHRRQTFFFVMYHPYILQLPYAQVSFLIII